MAFLGKVVVVTIFTRRTMSRHICYKPASFTRDLFCPVQRIISDGSEETDESDELWNDILNDIASVSKLITDARVNYRDYAKFLFLNERGEGQSTDHWNQEYFTGLREANLVVETSVPSEFKINPDHPRNKRIARIFSKLRAKLDQYQSEYREGDDDDLFLYSLDDVEFWRRYMGFNV